MLASQVIEVQAWSKPYFSAARHLGSAATTGPRADHNATRTAPRSGRPRVGPACGTPHRTGQWRRGQTPADRHGRGRHPARRVDRVSREPGGAGPGRDHDVRVLATGSPPRWLPRGAGAGLTGYGVRQRACSTTWAPARSSRCNGLLEPGADGCGEGDRHAAAGCGFAAERVRWAALPACPVPTAERQVVIGTATATVGVAKAARYRPPRSLRIRDETAGEPAGVSSDEMGARCAGARRSVDVTFSARIGLIESRRPASPRNRPRLPGRRSCGCRRSE